MVKWHFNLTIYKILFFYYELYPLIKPEGLFAVNWSIVFFCGVLFMRIMRAFRYKRDKKVLVDLFIYEADAVVAKGSRSLMNWTTF